MAEIRDAVEQDAVAILEIFNDLVATSTAVYTDTPTTLEERLAWMRDRARGGFPVLVAVDGEAVLGFASFGEFRGHWPGYRFTVEHSVHVRADARGRGVGTALLEELIRRATAAGKHVMIGAIDSKNEASIRFHERLGFERVAHLHEVGWKFDRWLDLVLVELRLPRSPGSVEPGM